MILFAHTLKWKSSDLIHNQSRHRSFLQRFPPGECPTCSTKQTGVGLNLITSGWLSECRCDFMGSRFWGDFTKMCVGKVTGGGRRNQISKLLTLSVSCRVMWSYLFRFYRDLSSALEPTQAWNKSFASNLKSSCSTGPILFLFWPTEGIRPGTLTGQRKLRLIDVIMGGSLF